MKLNEIYKKNINRRYCNVIDTKGKEIEIKSLPLESIKKNKYTVILISLIIVLVLLLTFHNNIKTFFVVIAFFIFMILTAFYFNNYSIKSKKDQLELRWNFQKFELPYNRLKGIFISREINGLDIVPIPTYNVVVRYVDNLNFIKELVFPAKFVDTEKLDEFIDNFIIENKKAEDCIKFEKYKKIKMIGKILGVVLLFSIIAIMVIASLSQQ